MTIVLVIGLKDIQLDISVCNWDRVTKHAPIGTICFALDPSTSVIKSSSENNSTAEEEKEKQNQSGEPKLSGEQNQSGELPFLHFREVGQNPRKAIAKWHTF